MTDMATEQKHLLEEKNVKGLWHNTFALSHLVRGDRIPLFSCPFSKFVPYSFSFPWATKIPIRLHGAVQYNFSLQDYCLTHLVLINNYFPQLDLIWDTVL